MTSRTVPTLYSLLATVVLLALLLPSAGTSRVRRSTDLPSGLAVADWKAIRHEYERHRHAAFPSNGELQARNFHQQWLSRFDGRGFTIQPDAGAWTWGLELESYGSTSRRQVLTKPAATRSSRLERIEYDWVNGIREWFVNDTRGLEHGLTLSSRPDVEGHDVELRFRVRGDLHAVVANDGRSLSFDDASGHPKLRYSGLKVWDAKGAPLPAFFQSHGNSIHLRFSDAGAVYPITIDPIIQQAYLKASNAAARANSAGDNFGAAVAISGETVVVGAPYESSNATGVNGNQGNTSLNGAGAAYVFVRNNGTWT
ncbi:MAG: FG-GAP repeat protein, partial [Bryobacterales bacterium]|nr:FG-GAP repeat protein [Bryobacterales bacterium]